jgi:hypothetical protein
MPSTAAASAEYAFSAGPRIVAKPSRGRRARRAFLRYLIAIGIGVAGTLAWQSHGDVIKQAIAAKAPELGWSPELQQLIVASLQQLGWTKPAQLESDASQTATPETMQQTPIARAATDPAASAQPAGPSPTSEQVQQLASDLATLKQAVGQLFSNQDQMTQDIAKVQATDQELLNKVSANSVAVNGKLAASKVSAPPPQTAAMPAHRHPQGLPASAEPSPPQPVPSR